MSLGRDRLGRVALVLVGLTIGIAGAELLLRTFQGARYGERPTFYPRHVELGWAPAPDLDHTYYGGDFAISIRTDAQGRRLGSLPAPTSADSTVLLLGDSYTFGWGVSTDSTFAHYLDEELATVGLRVVNLGVSGYGTLQHASRLAAELDGGRRSVRAVFVLHSHNDPVDNVTFAGAQAGLLRYVESDRNSGFHLHNLVRLATNALGSDSSSETMLAGGYRDFLWTVGAERTELGDSVASGSLESEAREMLDPEHGIAATYSRGGLTELQSRLLAQSITQIHGRAAEAGTIVLHSVIHTAPDWYVEALRTALDGAGTPDVGAWCGRIDVGGYDGPIENDHSGGHFTPGLNRRYAREAATHVWVGCGTPTPGGSR